MSENLINTPTAVTPDDFLPASAEEKQSLEFMRPSVSFWKDGFNRLRKNKVAMVSFWVIVVVMFFAFAVPSFYPYKYAQQIRGSERLAPMQYSVTEKAAIANGEKVFPHILGTDKLGRDYAIRVMNSPAASGSASASPGPWRSIRNSSSAMSRSPRWMSPSRPRSSTCSKTCSSRWA